MGVFLMTFDHWSEIPFTMDFRWVDMPTDEIDHSFDYTTYAELGIPIELFDFQELDEIDYSDIINFSDIRAICLCCGNGVACCTC